MRAARWVGFGAGAVAGVAIVALLVGEDRPTRSRPWPNIPQIVPAPDHGPPRPLDPASPDARADVLPPATGRADAWYVDESEGPG